MGSVSFDICARTIIVLYLDEQSLYTISQKKKKQEPQRERESENVLLHLHGFVNMSFDRFSGLVWFDTKDQL